jgi:hypothetical protein
VVLGALEQSEAEDLARAARLTGHWFPQHLGDTVLICSRERVHIVPESVEAEPLPALKRFVGGFLRQVAISDLHLGVKGRDTFGAHKEPALVRLLDEVIEQRATLVLNGDFLELMHESYGAIKRSYPEVFARSPDHLCAGQPRPRDESIHRTRPGRRHLAGPRREDLPSRLVLWTHA